MMMKFAANQPWKFFDYKLAYFNGLLQVIAVSATELATFYILLFESDSMIEVLANYAIVIVIVDFGGYFYLLINDRKNKTLITNEKYDALFTWETTTS